jgi:chorismate synthase
MMLQKLMVAQANHDSLPVTNDEIDNELDRRKTGQSKVTSQRKESDKVIINSGIIDGKTTGTPIEMVVFNEDADSSKYENIKDKYSKENLYTNSFSILEDINTDGGFNFLKPVAPDISDPDASGADAST